MSSVAAAGRYPSLGHQGADLDWSLSNENGRSHISVQDYAVAMINELETPAHVRERFTVGC